MRENMLQQLRCTLEAQLCAYPNYSGYETSQRALARLATTELSVRKRKQGKSMVW